MVTTTSSVLATFVDPQGGLRVEVATGSGFALAFDSAAEVGPHTAGLPVEGLLAALAACTSMDVASILRKKRQEATGYRILVTGERADEHPRVFTRIAVEHQVSGEVQPEALRRAIELSATRYCPVNAMLSRGVPIEHRYRLRRGGSDEISGLVLITGPPGFGGV